MSAFHLAARLLGGIAIGGNSTTMIGALLGYRGTFRLPSGILPNFTVGASYMHRWGFGSSTTYTYHVPTIRLAGGLSFGHGSRLSNGFELALDGGYAFQSNATPSEDYTGPYFIANLFYVLTF